MLAKTLKNLFSDEWRMKEGEEKLDAKSLKLSNQTRRLLNVMDVAMSLISLVR